MEGLGQRGSGGCRRRGRPGALPGSAGQPRSRAPAASPARSASQLPKRVDSPHAISGRATHSGDDSGVRLDISSGVGTVSTGGTGREGAVTALPIPVGPAARPWWRPRAQVSPALAPATALGATGRCPDLRLTRALPTPARTPLGGAVPGPLTCGTWHTDRPPGPRGLPDGRAHTGRAHTCPTTTSPARASGGPPAKETTGLKRS